MPLRKLFFISMFISIVFSCSSHSAKLQKTAESQLIEAAQAQYQTNYKIVYNPSKTNALCMQPLTDRKRKRSQYEQVSSFFIFDLQKGKVLYSESLGRGTVKWRSDTQVEIRLIPGIIKGGENMNDKNRIYIYDIISAKKYKRPILNNRD